LNRPLPDYVLQLVLVNTVCHISHMNTISRRHFLHSAAVGAATVSAFPSVLRAADPARPLKLGLIGCGWYGMVDVEAAFKVGGVEVIALCDVDSERLSQSADKVEKRQGTRNCSR
jgi:Zn-dependent alcohol dehydrogenase